MRIIDALLIANQALNRLEIKRCITMPSLPLAQTGIAAQAGFFFFSHLDIVLVPISNHFLCNYRVTLHHVAFENFPLEVNWVGAFWSILYIYLCRKLKQ